MPFFGSDWRAPGDKWVRTEVGWKLLADIHSNFQLQLSKVAASVMTASVKRSSARLRSHSGSPRNGTRNSSRASSRTSSPPRERHYQQKSLDEHRLHFLQLALAQRCVSARTSSRERSNYATISDAFNKLNFSQALHDTNCYPFICQVVGILFEVHYWTLSGSMQTALLRLTDTAKDIAIESKQHTGLILRLIDKQRDTLERGRCKMVTGFSISRLDSKIKTLIGYRAQLIGELQTVRSEDLPLLPDDCWRHILSFLTQPRDMLNLGSVNVKLYCLTSEELVWKNLIKYHYGMYITAADEDTCDGAVNKFRKIYIARRKQLKTLQSDAVALCHLCCCVYWRGYGHPCTASMRTSGLSAGRECTELSITPATADERLTAKQFVELF